MAKVLKTNIVKSIKIDSEIRDMILFLRKNRVKTDVIIREAAKLALKQACIDFKRELKTEKLPF